MNLANMILILEEAAAETGVKQTNQIRNTYI